MPNPCPAAVGGVCFSHSGAIPSWLLPASAASEFADAFVTAERVANRGKQRTAESGEIALVWLDLTMGCC